MVIEKTVRLAEACKIEPVVGHALGIARRREQAIDEALVRIRRRVGDESVDLLERRRQARQRQADAADQRLAVGCGRGREAFAVKKIQHEPVDIVRGRFRFRSVRDHGPLRLDERPMRAILGAAVDPRLEDRHMLR
jgi:hypothetical protein